MTKKYLITSFIFAFAINLFVILFVLNEKCIYFWDYSCFWIKWINFSNLLANHPLYALSVLYHSIRSDDYNLLAVSLLTPFYYIFSGHRLVYILAITNIYLIPCILVILWFLNNKVKEFYNIDDYFLFLLFIFFLSLLPQFWVPILFGYISISGIIIIFLIYHIYFSRPLEKQKLQSLFIISFLLVLLVFFRRWYAYWVVSFFVTIFFHQIYCMLKNKYFSNKQFKIVVINILIIGGLSAVLLFLIATPLANRMLLTDYSDIYSAYKISSSQIEVFYKFYMYFGPLLCLLLLIAVFQLFWNKKSKEIVVFLSIQLIIVYLSFTKTQDFSVHHYYLLLPMIIIIICLLFAYIFIHINNNILRFFFIFTMILLFIVNFGFVFSPSFDKKLPYIRSIFSNYRHYPIKRNDVNVVRKIYNTLANTIIKSNDNRIYVLASSSIFNDDILRNCVLNEPCPKNINDHILHTCHVDKRDGFPRHFLQAKYIVVASPIQYHLLPKDQRVIGILAEDILKRENIGKNYKKLTYDFKLDNDVHVYLYKKIGKFQESNLQKLSKEFRKYYPDREQLYQIERQ